MVDRSSTTTWQDWAIFGIRWVLILATGLVISLARSQAGPIESYTDFFIPLGVASVANLVLLIPLFVTALHRFSSYVQIPVDMVIAGALIALAGNDPLVLSGVISVLGVSSFLRLGWMQGIVGLALVIAASVGALYLTSPDALDGLDSFLPSVIFALAIVGSGMIWVYFRDSNASRNTRALERLRKEKDEQIQDMRENFDNFIEMATILNSTLNYERILDAALGLGRLCLRKAGSRTAGMILLYDAGSEALEIVNQRGLGHVDEHRRIRGESGIVGNAFKEGLPVIGGSSSNDPELRDFIAFGSSKSTLVIPLRAGYDSFGAAIYASDAENAFDPDKINALNAISTLATIALQNAVLYRNLIEERDRIIELQENARKSLVRDLHDIPTQTISAITMRVRIIQRLLETQRYKELDGELANVEEMALRATEEIRHVLFKLRPLALESQGLRAALESLAEKNRKTHSQNVQIRIEPDAEGRIDQQAQGTLFYLIEEAVSNARKYAKAKQVLVTIEQQNEILITRIRDNGVGFDVAQVNGSAGTGSSYGMTNMRERAELLNGTVEIDSAPGKGTTVSVYVPLDEHFGRGDTRRNVKVPVPETKLSQSAMSRVTGRLR